MMLLIDVVQDVKPVIWAKSNLPLRREWSRLAKRLAVLRFDVWLKTQLFLDRFANQAIVLGIDGLQMRRHSARVDQSIGLPPRHDGHDSDHRQAICQGSMSVECFHSPFMAQTLPGLFPYTR